MALELCGSLALLGYSILRFSVLLSEHLCHDMNYNIGFPEKNFKMLKRSYAFAAASFSNLTSF